jgi:hypothetical protein
MFEVGFLTNISSVLSKIFEAYEIEKLRVLQKKVFFCVCHYVKGTMTSFTVQSMSIINEKIVLTNSLCAMLGYIHCYIFETCTDSRNRTSLFKLEYKLTMELLFCHN